MESDLRYEILETIAAGEFATVSRARDRDLGREVAVKQIHATPAVIHELLPTIAKESGPPASWADLRERVMAFPVDRMGAGLQRLSRMPSQHRLRNRLEDTMRNASFVGLAVAHGPIMDVA